jgi:hypothetical protein
MHPVTQQQLLDVPHCGQVLGYQKAAMFYAQILASSKTGITTLTSASMSPGIVFDTAFGLIKQSFPDCSVTIEVHGLFTGDLDRSYAIRVDWNPR